MILMVLEMIRKMSQSAKEVFEERRNGTIFAYGTTTYLYGTVRVPVFAQPREEQQSTYRYRKEET